MSSRQFANLFLQLFFFRKEKSWPKKESVYSQFRRGGKAEEVLLFDNLPELSLTRFGSFDTHRQKNCQLIIYFCNLMSLFKEFKLWPMLISQCEKDR